MAETEAGLGFMNDLFAEIIKRPHPALVHFPISLYPISTVFFVLFMSRDATSFLQVSYWCFLIASLFMVPVATTGFLDYIRLKSHSDKAHHLLQIHLFNGVIATLIGIISGVFFWLQSPFQYDEWVPLYGAISSLLTIMVLAQGAIAALMVYQHKLGVDGETR